MKINNSKPHVNVGTIGHVDHGRATLTAAIVAVQLRRSSLNEDSLPVLTDLDSKSKPKQEIKMVVSPDYFHAHKKAGELKDLTKELESRPTSLNFSPEWNHPYPPSGRGRKKR